PSSDIDGFDIAELVIDTDRIEQLRQRKRDLAQIHLVIANADVVIGVTVDHENVDVAGRPGLVALAGGADGCPQTCEPGTEHHDPRHRPLPARSSVPPDSYTPYDRVSQPWAAGGTVAPCFPLTRISQLRHSSVVALPGIKSRPDGSQRRLVCRFPRKCRPL